MTVALVGIMSAASIALYNTSLNDARFDATYKEMLQIRKALIGDLENTTVEGERIRFGMLGDIGVVPTTGDGLAAINSKPASYAAWAIDNNTSKLGLGWNGPYIVTSSNIDFLQDAWGTDYQYFADTPVPVLISCGSDKQCQIGGQGTAQDIEVTLPLSLRTASVRGQITTSGSVYEGAAQVTIYYPTISAGVTGVLRSVTTTADSEGAFNFTNIPFGIRSLKVSVPSVANDILDMSPVTITVDNPNFLVPNNILQINPQNSSSNCNTVGNVEVVPGSVSKEDSLNRVNFQLEIDESFAIKTLTMITSRSITNQAPKQVQQISIGGVVYGCRRPLGGVFDRTFNTLSCNTAGQRYIDLNSSPQHTLNKNWGIAAGGSTAVDAFIQFNDSTSSGLFTYIDITLGCDVVRISGW